MKKSALVIFKEEFGKNDVTWLQTTPVSDVVIAPNKLREEIEKTVRKWESL